MPTRIRSSQRFLSAAVHTVAAACAIGLTVATYGLWRAHLASWMVLVISTVFIIISHSIADHILARLTPPTEPRAPIPHATSVPPLSR